MEREESYKELLIGFITNQLSPEEVAKVYDFIAREPEAYERLMADPGILFLLGNAAGQQTPLPERVEHHFQTRIEEATHIAGAEPGRIRPMGLFHRWRTIAAAAAVVAALAIGFILFRRPGTSRQSMPALRETAITAPDHHRAILTLGNGTSISLDSLHIGNLNTVADQGARIAKPDSSALVYTGQTSSNKELVYNTLATPKGAQYHVRLSDGTDVWLNASSSIRYPTAFNARERIVEITGEAYFEVAKDKSRPFHIKTSNVEVAVLGTRFNIKAYADDPAIRTSLLDGSIKVTGQPASSGYLLQPGQQAITSTADRSTSVVNIRDIGQTIAWKNGIFRFEHTPLTEALRDIARWYDVSITYAGDVSDKKVGGELEQDLSLPEILDGLKDIGVKFRIEGNKVTVTP